MRILISIITQLKSIQSFCDWAPGFSPCPIPNTYFFMLKDTLCHLKGTLCLRLQLKCWPFLARPLFLLYAFFFVSSPVLSLSLSLSPTGKTCVCSFAEEEREKLKARTFFSTVRFTKIASIMILLADEKMWLLKMDLWKMVIQKEFCSLDEFQLSPKGFFFQPLFLFYTKFILRACICLFRGQQVFKS